MALAKVSLIDGITTPTLLKSVLRFLPGAVRKNPDVVPVIAHRPDTSVGKLYAINATTVPRVNVGVVGRGKRIGPFVRLMRLHIHPVRTKFVRVLIIVLFVLVKKGINRLTVVFNPPGWRQKTTRREINCLIRQFSDLPLTNQLFHIGVLAFPKARKRHLIRPDQVVYDALRPD